MDTNFKDLPVGSIQNFRLPRYDELPNTGLYLDQTTKYINLCFAPLGCIELTGSMIRNYVKMGLVKNPVQKQYFADHIAHLLAITLLKQVISMEHISMLFERQKQVYTDPVAYNYFCMELENILFFRFGLKPAVEDIGRTSSLEKEMLRSAVIAVSQIIYLNACFEHTKPRPFAER